MNEPETSLEFLESKISAKDKKFANKLINRQDKDGLCYYEEILRKEERKGLIHAVRVCSALSAILLNHTITEGLSKGEIERTNKIAINICKHGIEYARKQHPDTGGKTYRDLSLARIFLCYGIALARTSRPYGAMENLQYSFSYNGQIEDCVDNKEKEAWFVTFSQYVREYSRLLWRASYCLPQDISIQYVRFALDTADLMCGQCPETEKLIKEIREKQPGIYDYHKNQKFVPIPHSFDDETEKKYREWAYECQLFLSHYSSLPYSKQWSRLLYDDLFFEFGGEQVCQHLFFETKAIYARCRWLYYEFTRASTVKKELEDHLPKYPDDCTLQEKLFLEESYLMDYCSNGCNTDAPTEYQILFNCYVRLYSIFDKIAMLIYLYRPEYFPNELRKGAQEKGGTDKRIYFRDVAEAIKSYMRKEGTNSVEDLMLLRVAEMSAEMGYCVKNSDFFFKINPEAEKMNTIRNSILHKGVQLVDDKDKFDAGKELLVLSVNDLSGRTFELIRLCKEMILTTILAFEIGKRETD